MSAAEHSRDILYLVLCSKLGHLMTFLPLTVGVYVAFTSNTQSTKYWTSPRF